MDNISKVRVRLSLIQTFRGIAAVLVLLYHSAGLFEQKLGYNFMYGAFSQGYSGVDFFFVLSGFIIYYAHYKDIGRPEKLKTFLIKRFIRLYPVYWVVLLAVIPIYFIAPSFGMGYEREVPVILKSLALLPQQHLPILGVAWTMSYEVLFYSIFSLMIWLKPRVSYPVILCWLIITGIMSVKSISPVTGFGDNVLLNYIFSAYNFEFAAGCAIGYFTLKFRAPRWGNALILAGTVAYISSCVISQSLNLGLRRQLLFGIPLAVILLGSAKKDINGKTKMPGILEYIGDASYSIYLTHQPVVSLLFKLEKATGFYQAAGEFLGVAVIAAIALLIGCLFHSVVEKPILKLSRRKLIKPYH